MVVGGVDALVVTSTEDILPGWVCGSGSPAVVDVTTDNTLPVGDVGSVHPLLLLRRDRLHRI